MKDWFNCENTCYQQLCGDSKFSPARITDEYSNVRVTFTFKRDLYRSSRTLALNVTSKRKISDILLNQLTALNIMIWVIIAFRFVDFITRLVSLLIVIQSLDSAHLFDYQYVMTLDEAIPGSLKIKYLPIILLMFQGKETEFEWMDISAHWEKNVQPRGLSRIMFELTYNSSKH